MATGKVDYNSDLLRKHWMDKGLLQGATKSFWSPLTSNSMNSIVYLAKNGTAKDGHTVVFDFDGNLSGKAIKGRNVAYGKGEQKRKFSDKITVDRYRLVVDNGDIFDSLAIGDLSSYQHMDSRGKLSDLFHRTKDQNIFDTAQGTAGQEPSHIIDLGSDLSYNKLLDIEKTLKTSTKFSYGGLRRPLQPYIMKDGRSCWMFVLDAAMAAILRKDENYQTLVFNADVRGEQNRAIKGVFGKLGQLLLVEADIFFGKSEGTGVTSMDNTGVEIPGLRQKDSNGIWTGQEGFSYEGAMSSRGLLLGAGAFQFAMGMQPNYHYKPSTDFDITSESACEFWMGMKKTRLKAEQSDYNQARVAGFDYGVIAVDLQVQS